MADPDLLARIIAHAVALWRAGRISADLRDARATTIEAGSYAIRIVPHPPNPDETLRVNATVVDPAGRVVHAVELKITDA